jgi:Ca2+-binding EF-hand superfamily protein
LNYSEYDNFDVDKEVFAMLDKSSTGFVDFAELDRLLEMFGYSAVSKEMLQKILGAGSKDISFDSFKKLMARVNEDNSG